MTRKLTAALLALGFSVMIFGVGCSKDDNNDTPEGPSQQERLVGYWDATNPDELTGGAGYVEFDFASDSTFSLLIAAITGPLDDTVAVHYTGDYLAEGDGHMHMTNIEVDGESTQDSWEWPFSEFGSDDSLTVTHDGIVEGTAVVHYLNVTPPALTNVTRAAR